MKDSPNDVMDVRSSHGRPTGPSAGMLGIVILGLTIAGVVVPALIAGRFTVSPFESTANVADYYLGHPAGASVSGFLVFASSVPLGIYAATVYARMLKLGVRVPGPGIAFYGGIAASVFLALSGLIDWTLGQEVAAQTAAVIHTLAYLSFALGGVGFVGGVGLLIAGLAVPSAILGLTPRWFAWVGLVLAAIGELGFVSLLVPNVAFLLPIGRFLGLAWLLVAGFLLPHDLRSVRRGRS